MDWTAVLAGYRSTVDWPAAAFWRQLTEAFPEARVVLTVREAEAWYDSVERTIYRLHGDGPADERTLAARRAVPGLDVVADLHRKVIWDGFFGGRFADRAHAIGAYERHNAAVIRDVDPDRLLVVTPGAGWGPRCDFLGVAVPAEPYPHVNDTETFWAGLGAGAQRAGST